MRQNISAGEFFDLIRPAVLMLSAVVSIWVLASARKRQYSLFLATAWALGTLFFPLIILPLFSIARLIQKRRQSVSGEGNETRAATVSGVAPRWRFSVPLVYGVIVVSSLALYLYQDQESVDAHLARATQARVSNQPGRTIQEYRAALRKEDDPHTHKLLAMELAETGDWTGALQEFRAAEQGGETDDLIPFRIATLLDLINHPYQATTEYQRFLQTSACTQQLPDNRCAAARARLQTATKNLPD